MSSTNNPHKVTAHQAGALSITGGTLTGKTLYFDNGNSCLSGGQGYMLMDVYGAPKDSSNFRRMEVRGGDTELSGALVLKERINGVDKTHSIYGSHNKPKASDVGAMPTAGGTMTGPLVFDSNVAWGQIVMHTPSGHYRGFESSDDRARIDVRDGTASSKRRYLDIYPISAEAERSKALRLGETADGETTEAYVLHTENINNFVVSHGIYQGDGNQIKTIPVRKTTKAAIILPMTDESVSGGRMIVIRNSMKALSQLGYNSSETIHAIIGDDGVKITAIGNAINRVNEAGKGYTYVLIG